MPQKICIKAWVSGRVQGVSYRAYTQREAQRLGLAGYARNLADGRVEVLACGDESQVRQLLDWLHQASPNARVTAVDSQASPWQELTDFTTG